MIDLVGTEAKLKQLWKIDNTQYPDANISFDAFSAWWRRYDLGLRVAVSKDGVITGGVGIWALAEADIRGLISGRLAENSLLPLTADELEQQPSQFWYFSGIFASPLKSLNSPLRALLKTGVGSWCNSHHVRYPLYTYALGFSLDGIELLNRFGFEQIKSAAETADNMPLYVRTFASPAELRGLLP